MKNADCKELFSPPAVLEAQRSQRKTGLKKTNASLAFFAIAVKPMFINEFKKHAKIFTGKYDEE
jgi:hypothetical protein